MACPLCLTLEDCRLGRSERFVHEFPRSVLLVGEHQVFPGYCLLVLKDHVRDLHDLPPLQRREYFDELMQATDAIVAAFSPHKMNHACYGNQVPHLHWHIFPRYVDDPHPDQLPWHAQNRFHDSPTTPEQSARVRSLVKPRIEAFLQKER